VFSKQYIKEFKTNVVIALPVALSQLGHMAVGVTDTIMVGGLGGGPLASVTVAFSIFIPFMMLGIGISYGISPLIAKADGENNVDEIKKILKHSIILNMGVGVLLGTILYLSSPLLKHLNQPESVVDQAISFFEIMAITMVPLMFFQTFRQFAEGLAITRQAMYITVSANIINIILNYVLIHGRLGLPALGANGAAYATLVARIFMGITMFAFVFYHPKFKVYWKNLSSVIYSPIVYVRLLKMSLPVGLQLSLESGAFGFAALMIGWLGRDEIAAHHIALTLAAIPYMAATGLASATTVRVGNEYGKKDYKSLRISGFSGFYLAIGFMSFTALNFVLFKNVLPLIFIQDTHIIEIASSLLLIAAFFQLSDGIQVVGLGALRGIGDVRKPTIIALLAYWLIGLPVGYFLAFNCKIGVEGIWYGLFLGLMIAATLLFIRFFVKSKKMISQ
jgi:MATE family multidrug resistance protein